MSSILRATLALAAMVLAQPAAAADPANCTTPENVTLTGKVHALQSMREEPQAEMQTFFDLELPAPYCGKEIINASVIGNVSCAEGSTITMTGELSPPGKLTGMAFFRGRAPVSCTP